MRVRPWASLGLRVSELGNHGVVAGTPGGDGTLLLPQRQLPWMHGEVHRVGHSSCYS